jgi:hypothetical protein
MPGAKAPGLFIVTVTIGLRTVGTYAACFVWPVLIVHCALPPPPRSLTLPMRADTCPNFRTGSLQRVPAAAAFACVATFTLICFGFASSRFGMLSVSTPF